jgi:tetratricopeptide (TPR) repeat protein
MRSSLSSTTTPIDADEFLAQLQPVLSSGNLQHAMECVQVRWTSCQVTTLLKDPSADVRKVAALALSLVGDRRAVLPLAIALHDADPMVTQVAEHALWSIWFRLGKPSSVRLVHCGVHHLQHNNRCCAIERFTQAIQDDPAFSEAYNQRAIAWYLSEHFDKAIADCKSALVLMPQHFGAMSGLGHCHAHLGQWRQAKHCYRLALAIHPRLEGTQASLDQIDRLLHENPAL